MILIETLPQDRPVDFLMVAQNPSTYMCLGFSAEGTPFDYDTDHTVYDGNGRYKVKDGSLPATENELRVEFFTNYKNKKLPDLKAQRERGKLAPITVTINGVECTFDLDEAARTNINNTVEDFESARLKAVSKGWPDDGTIPWVSADNNSLAVTLADLQEVKAQGTARGMELHMDYNLAKAELEALIPDPIV